MVSTCSDAHLNLDRKTVRQEFHSDLRCIVESHLPELKRAINPQKHVQSPTSLELQQCICLLLFHVASKAQTLGYRSGFQACNASFKHFLYVCRHIDLLPTLSSIRILDGIERCLSTIIRSFDLEGEDMLSEMHNSQPLDQAIEALNQTISDVIKQRISTSS